VGRPVSWWSPGMTCVLASMVEPWRNLRLGGGEGRHWAATVGVGRQAVRLP
jgi:hypothetical protein